MRAENGLRALAGKSRSIDSDALSQLITQFSLVIFLEALNPHKQHGRPLCKKEGRVGMRIF